MYIFKLHLIPNLYLSMVHFNFNLKIPEYPRIKIEKKKAKETLNLHF